MKLSQIFSGVPVTLGEEAGNREIAGITCDSRRAGPGWAFVCIRGTGADGHRYAAQAEKAGAAVIIAEEAVGCPGCTGTAALVLVPSTRSVWAQMCANWFGRPGDRLHLIGITGTNGKTSTTYMLKTVLEACGQKVGLIGTIQNMIGERVLPSAHTTPDPYDLQSMLALMAAEGCTYAVMEVSSHALDQERVGGCTFDAAVFTNLTQDHLDYHGTMENYLAAKKKLFSLCRYAVVNADDPWAEKLTEGLTCPVVTYSAHLDQATYTAKNIRPRPDGVDFELVGTAQIGRIRLEMKTLCVQAGIEATKVFPHNLRHLFARCYYQVCHDIVKLADILGHSHIETTRIYLLSTGTEHQYHLERLRLVS